MTIYTKIFFITLLFIIPNTLLASNEMDVFNDINSVRIESGSSPILYSKTLEKVAKKRAKEMARLSKRFDHTRTGKDYDFVGYLQKNGYEFCIAAENLSFNYEYDLVVEKWMNSNVHREYMLDSRFKEVGIGIAYGPGFLKEPSGKLVRIKIPYIVQILGNQDCK